MNDSPVDSPTERACRAKAKAAAPELPIIFDSSDLYLQSTREKVLLPEVSKDHWTTVLHLNLFQRSVFTRVGNQIEYPTKCKASRKRQCQSPKPPSTSKGLRQVANISTYQRCWLHRDRWWTHSVDRQRWREGSTADVSYQGILWELSQLLTLESQGNGATVTISDISVFLDKEGRESRSPKGPSSTRGWWNFFIPLPPSSTHVALLDEIHDPTTDRYPGRGPGVTGNSAARKFCSQRHNFLGNYAAQRQHFLQRSG